MSSTLADLLNSANIRQAPPAPQAAAPGSDLEIMIEGHEPDVDEKTGALTIEHGDGSVTIDFGKAVRSKLTEKFSANLADDLGIELSGLAQDLITDIDGDISSRSEWMDQREQGLELLGLKIEQPRGDTGNSSAPLEGMSTVRATTLLQACLKFQANARGELLPAAGPVKIMDKGPGSGVADEWAEILEKDMNVYLTQTATEYYPDTDRMLFYVGFGGSGFKKVYHCALRRRPVSESVDAADLIVNANATDLANARRITHRLHMRDSMVRRMQTAGVYRDVELSQAAYQPTADEVATAKIRGVDIFPVRAEDNDRTIYETLCERDFGEHPDGMPLPYKVVIDKDSQQVLEVRRNWVEGDPMYMPVNMYVRYPYVEALGIYGIGLLHIVGNMTKALTAAIREMLDTGMFANFPGFVYGEGVARQETNEFRIPPGGGMRIQTGGGSIRDAIMPLPYKDVSPGLMQLVEALTAAAEKLSGTAELPTGEGIQNAPVGTTLAIIDQATKVLDAVHKRIHAAQAEEFRLLRDRFLEDPEAFWRHNPVAETNWNKETFVQALQFVDLVPVADPNTPTHTHRLMKAQALVQLAQAYPQEFDGDKVATHALRLLGFANPDEFKRPAGAPPPPNPEMMKMQLEQQKLQQQGQQAAGKLAVDRQRNQLEATKAQLQARVDGAQIKTEQDIAENRLEHDRKVDGASIASESLEHMNSLAGVAPPPPAGAGPSASPTGG
jgi:hypothetical protein